MEIRWRSVKLGAEDQKRRIRQRRIKSGSSANCTPCSWRSFRFSAELRSQPSLHRAEPSILQSATGAPALYIAQKSSTNTTDNSCLKWHPVRPLLCQFPAAFCCIMAGAPKRTHPPWTEAVALMLICLFQNCVENWSAAQFTRSCLLSLATMLG